MFYVGMPLRTLRVRCDRLKRRWSVLSAFPSRWVGMGMQIRSGSEHGNVNVGDPIRAGPMDSPCTR